jgi:predicted DNA-binding ribbon-helix-helix protein
MSDLYSPQNKAGIITDSNAEAKKPLLIGALISKNVRIHDRRTSVRLEPEMWDALNEVALLEECSIHDLCGAVHDMKDEGASFTAALRVFLMEYYRTAAKTSQQVGQIQRHLQAGRRSGRLSALAADLSQKISA